MHIHLTNIEQTKAFLATTREDLTKIICCLLPIKTSPLLNMRGAFRLHGCVALFVDIIVRLLHMIKCA